MKKILFICLLFLAGNAIAETFEEIGIGPVDDSGSALWPSYPTYNPVNTNTLNLHTPYPGNNLFHIHYCSNPGNLQLQYYNCSDTDCSVAYCPSGIVAVSGYSCKTYDFNCSSNKGIYHIILPGAGQFDLASSTVTNIITDYSGSTYIQGNHYTVPVVNRFLTSRTVYVYDYETALDVTNNTALAYGSFAPVCPGPTGVNEVRAYNDNTSTMLDEGIDYSFYATFTAAPDLNFTYQTPANPVYASLGDTITFSVGVSNPGAVQYTAFYVNGGQPVGTGGSQNLSFSYKFEEAGTYIVQLQVENYCQTFPTANWTVQIGDSVTLYGRVYANTTYGNTPLPGATVILKNQANPTQIYTDTTDAFGDYSISISEHGTYLATVSKTNYAPIIDYSIYLNYDGNFNQKFYLNPATPTNATTLNIDTTEIFIGGYPITVYANYQYNNANIDDAVCTYASAGFNPDTGTLTHLGGLWDYYAPSWLINTPGTYTLNVSCQKQGYTPKNATISYNIPTTTTSTTTITGLTTSTTIPSDSVVYWYGAAGYLCQNGCTEIDTPAYTTSRYVVGYWSDLGGYQEYVGGATCTLYFGKTR